MEVIFIKSENNVFKKSDNHHNFWFHRVDLNIISNINQEMRIGAERKNSKNILKINSGDRIFILTKRDNLIEIVAYTQVEEVYQSNDSLYDYYFSKRKLKLKGIKYLSKPILPRDIADKLDFVINKEKPSNYFSFEYREVSKEDFSTVFKQANLIKTFPTYLEKVSMTLKEFILNTIKAVYRMVKHYESRKQIEIKSFINILKKFLDEYGIKKSVSEIQEFYEKHAIELGFKHIPSRDPDKFVALCLPNGETRNFAYISLE